MEAFTNFKHHKNAESINRALKILYQEKLITDEDIHEIAERDHIKYPSSSVGVVQKISNYFGNFKKASSESLVDAKERAVLLTTEVAKNVDMKAHESPWIFLGAASVMSGIFGYYIGHKFKR